MFLLDADAQRRLICKVSTALVPGGKFLFTSPRQACEWRDSMTGHKSVSLGSDEYRRILENAGLVLGDEANDEGDNHYLLAVKA